MQNRVRSTLQVEAWRALQEVLEWPDPEVALSALGDALEEALDGGSGNLAVAREVVLAAREELGEVV